MFTATLNTFAANVIASDVLTAGWVPTRWFSTRWFSTRWCSTVTLGCFDSGRGGLPLVRNFLTIVAGGLVLLVGDLVSLGLLCLIILLVLLTGDASY